MITSHRTYPFILIGLGIVGLLTFAAVLIFTGVDRKDDLTRANFKQWEAECYTLDGFVVLENDNVLCVNKKRNILNVWHGPTWPYHEDKK